MYFLVVGIDEVSSSMILSINGYNYEVMTATNAIDGLIQTYVVKEDRATTDLMLILDDVFRMTTLVVIQNLIPHSNSRSEEHTSELQSHVRISYAVFCLKKKKKKQKK